MSKSYDSKEGIGELLNRTQIARSVYNAAASMGMSDREQIDNITGVVIARLERPAMLPGMEEFMPKGAKQPLSVISEPDILAIVKELLAVGESLTQEVIPPPAHLALYDDNSDIKPAESKVSATSKTESKARSKKETSAMPVKAKVNTAKLSQNAMRVLEKRYLKKDKQGNVIESPEDMFQRVAQTIAAAELNYNPQADVQAWADRFYEAMTNLDFLPNSPTLMNAGRELGQLSACFVLPIDDSMESIFEAVKNTALIHKSGGGTGFSFSRLRPETDRVGTTGGVASGPVSFMRAFDVATDVIKQGGTRRGANMAILNVTHPDILRFISSKEDMVSLTNFNISVAVTTDFMQSVRAGADYELINPRTKESAGKLNAKMVFDKMVELAWKTGDPGVIFIDSINKDNPTPQIGQIESTNPCGEQPLLPYESCNLGSINLSRMLKNNEKKEIDYEKLRSTVKLAVRFLDNVIDVNRFPIPAIGEMTRRTRKIGLGVMGFADMLIQLGIPYNSEDALYVAEDVMGIINNTAHKVSMELGAERGEFPAFSGSIYDKPDAPKVRNASCTTIAPTGTLSIIANCSGGVEPVFALSFTRNILDGAKFIEVNPYFEEAARAGGFYSEDLMHKLADGEHLKDVEGVPDAAKLVFVTAHDIEVQWHVRMQAAFQRHTDNAVSKTVNFSKDATAADVAKVYMMAYEEKLKGITIYRDGSRDGQVLTTGKDCAKEKEKEVRSGVLSSPRKRSKVTNGFTERVTTGCGYIYVTVNSDENGICEVFSHLGKTGGCAAAQLESSCRLISLGLRSGIDVASLVKQLKGIRCPSIAWENSKSILSCADAIAGVLEHHAGLAWAKDEDGVGYDIQDLGLVKNVAGQCPECTSLLAYQEGCLVCPGCGYTKC
ncbi:MAG: vitamin B12-dependent ribonucleotide reductase [Dehalococcoidia bacterium]|nr:vitamin B12-dependent ribonucleotide reductase [Dehalococcoidia bacterium]